MARAFTAASSHRLNASPGAVTPVGAFTLAVVVRLQSIASNQYPVTFLNSTSAQVAFRLTTSGITLFYNNGIVTPSPTVTFPASDGWALLAATKTSGTSPVRVHKYRYATDAWTRSDTAAVATASLPVSTINFGHLDSSFYLNGDIAAAAYFPAALTDDQVSSLPFALAAWWSLAPSALWVFDQSATTQSLVDLTGGGANQSAINGTAVSTESVPLFSYGADPIVEDSPPWDGELANTGGGVADETAVTTGNSAAGGDPWNLVTTATGAEVTYDDVNSNTWHRFATGATSGQARAEWTSASITAPMSRVYGGFWFRIPAAALGVNNTYLMRARAATVQTTRISISTGNKLQIRNTSNSSAEQGAHTIVADTDYFVRYDVTVGASAAATVELYSAAGTLIETLAPTGVNFGTGAVDEVGYGIASNVSSQPAYLLRGFVSSATAWPAPPAPPAGTTPNGVAVAVALGSPTVATTLTTAPAGIAVPVAVGSPATAYSLTTAPAGLSVPVALGSPSTAIPGVTPAGVAVPVALGSPAASGAALVPAGISVPVTPGTPATALNRSAAPSGAAVPVAVGTPAAAVTGASPAGIAVPVVTGSPAASVLIQPNGVPVPLSLGVPTVALNRSAAPAGFGVPVAVGAPATAYNLATAPSGLAVTVAAGTPTVGHLGAAPAGIALTLALGPPATAYTGAVGPDGIALLVAVGSPRANNVRPTVPRPSAGTVDRPSGGTVERPFAGFVTR